MKRIVNKIKVRPHKSYHTPKECKTREIAKKIGYKIEKQPSKWRTFWRFYT